MGVLDNSAKGKLCLDFYNRDHWPAKLVHKVPRVPLSLQIGSYTKNNIIGRPSIL